MWTAIKGGILVIAAFFGWRKAEAEADLRGMDREAGRNEQRVSDADKAIDRAREANAREEDISRLSGDALDERMRKSME